MKHICKTLFLLALAALFCVLPLASCIPGKGERFDGHEDTPIDPNAAEDTYDWARAQVPTVNYEGRDFRILVCKSVSQFDIQNGDLARNVVAKELLDIPINDAVFNRNMDLQTQLGVTIRATEKPFRKVADELRSSILTQDDRYDICFTRLDDLTPLASEGLLVNLWDMDLDLSKPWWDQNSIEELTIQDELFFAVSDGDIVDKQTTMACMFNKTLMEEQKIDPATVYAMVDGGTWTIDAMLDIAKNVRKDKNGDGLYNSEDVWPILSEYDSATCFYYAFGGCVTDKNASDEPRLRLGDPDVRSAVDAALDLMRDDEMVFKVEQMGNDWVRASDMFINNQAMFRITNLTTTERWRNMEADFGVLPMPKLNEDQSEYVHLCKNGATGVCVPNTNTDLDFTAICLEAFVSFSRYTLREAYFESTMQGMVSRDPDTPRMLDLIFTTRAFDLGYIFDFGASGAGKLDGIGYLLKKIAANPSMQIDSQWDSIKDKAQSQIDDMLVKLEASRS